MNSPVLIRCLRPAAEFPLIFTPSQLFFFSLSSVLASSSSAAVEGRGRGADLITLYMSESLRIVVIHEFPAVRVRPLGSTSIRRRTGKIPEEPSSKPSAAPAESTTERFLNCFTTTGHTCVCERICTVCQDKGMTGAKSHHGLCNFNLFWNPWRVWIHLLEQAGFYTLPCVLNAPSYRNTNITV